MAWRREKSGPHLGYTETCEWLVLNVIVECLAYPPSPPKQKNKTNNENNKQTKHKKRVVLEEASCLPTPEPSCLFPFQAGMGPWDWHRAQELAREPWVVSYHAIGARDADGMSWLDGMTLKYIYIYNIYTYIYIYVFIYLFNKTETKRCLAAGNGRMTPKKSCAHWWLVPRE